jgi:hypothetical protein
MDDADFTLQIQNLPKMDLIEIDKRVLPDLDVELRTLDQSEERYGEPATLMAIIAVGTIALPALLLWLAGKRKKITVEDIQSATLPDGTKVKRVVRLKIGESGPPDPAVIEQLRKLPVLDPHALAKALASLTGSDS